MVQISSLTSERSASYSSAVIALVAGAMAMGVSPVFVRIADVGPFASAFWRVGAALPLLLIWALIDGGRAATLQALRTPSIWLSGLFFTVDLFFWHLAVLHTTIANATFLATMAPIWVVAGSWAFIGEKVDRRILLGVALCIAGGATLLGGSFQVDPERFVGDLYGVGTSLGFGAYFLAVRVARRQFSPGVVVFSGSLVTALFLLCIALLLEPAILPTTTTGILAILGLSVVSHSGGQGLLAYALGHLSAAFSSLVIFLEALAAALVAWIVFGETIGFAQMAGGLMILIGIFIARPRN